jgi:hypothetical protein
MKKKQPKHRRKKIPVQIETEVQVQSKYRCCLCYSLDGDDTEKRGQIAHIDHDSSNNRISNLAFLCHDHHSRYDSSSLQSKGITQGVLRAALEKLLSHLRLRGEKSVTLTLTIDREFESFTDQEYADLIAEVSRAAKTKGIITKVSVSRGSVKLMLAVDGEDAVRVIQAFEASKLASLGVTKVDYPQGIYSAISVFKEFDSQLGILTKEQILAAVASPDYSQNVSDRPGGSRLFVKDEFPKPGFATLALVVSESDRSWTVARGVVIPRDALTSWPIEHPQKLLGEFADRFGIPLPRFGSKKIIFDETIPVLYGPISDALIRALDYKRPESLLYSCLVKGAISGARSIWIELACKFGDRYALALQERGFSIDLEKWRQREQISFRW